MDAFYEYNIPFHYGNYNGYQQMIPVEEYMKPVLYHDQPPEELFSSP